MQIILWKNRIVKEKFAEYLQAEFETGFEDEEMSEFHKEL